MTKQEKRDSRYDYGYNIFFKLFNLKSDDLILKLQEILKDKLTETAFKRIFDWKPIVEKVTVNDDPESIAVYVYDRLEITPIGGITYRPENRSQSETLIYFDIDFKFSLDL